MEPKSTNRENWNQIHAAQKHEQPKEHRKTIKKEAIGDSPYINPLESRGNYSAVHQIIWSWYIGRWWVGCYIWYSEKETGRGPSPPRPLLAVPNVTVHPSTASVPITVLQYNGQLLCGFNVGIKGLNGIKQRLTWTCVLQSTFYKYYWPDVEHAWLPADNYVSLACQVLSMYWKRVTWVYILHQRQSSALQLKCSECSICRALCQSSTIDK